jgi:hypothetical protein
MVDEIKKKHFPITDNKQKKTPKLIIQSWRCMFDAVSRLDALWKVKPSLRGGYGGGGYGGLSNLQSSGP